MREYLSKLWSHIFDVYLTSMRCGVYPISFSFARFLKLLSGCLCTRSSVRVLEIGSGFGFSTSWFAISFRFCKFPSFVISIDINFNNVKVALKNINVDNLVVFVDFIVCDGRLLPFRVCPYFDIVFIDADKEYYVDYLNECDKYLKIGGLVIAHNVFLPEPHKLSNFLKEILESSKWFSILVPVDPAGTSISLKVM